ncbi:nucleolar protein dao-5 [Corythoichthys intestinalis]|uniref:nucleolar protein dao-5 n=1 Tax=Corythoichthys intestinalis TaxID=161448 RepID=UPI0025A5B39E|nr:nucleolar protein dao-5 [Corythoichthys intestinalis]
MSVNASQQELIVLIFRHLKENGFHSAAEELLKHSPQGSALGTTELSSSLGDIYSSWLKKSKSKHSTSNGGVSTQIQAASKKEKKTVKKAQKQKSPSKKDDKDRKLSETVKRKKLKKQENVVAPAADGGVESDSDSSLDVEKWKKMLFEMTDVNAMTMRIDTINALDSSSAKPVKKRVRKPQAKPKSGTPLKQPGKKESDSEKAVKEKKTKSSSAKRTILETAEPENKLPTLNGTLPLILSEEGATSSCEDKQKKKSKKRKQMEGSESEIPEIRIENGSKESKVVGQPVEDLINCSNLNSEPQDEHVMVCTIGNDEAVKRKKKEKKKGKEATDGENLSEFLIKDKNDMKTDKEAQNNQNVSQIPIKGQKDDKNNATDSPNISDTLIKHKKKKKKKKRDDLEELAEPLAEETKTQTTLVSEEIDEQPSTQENPGLTDDDKKDWLNTVDASDAVREKKAKEKKRKSHPEEGTTQRVVEKEKKRKSCPEEGTPQQEKKKRKKDKANLVEDESVSVNIEEIVSPNAEVKKKKKKKLGLTDTVLLFSPETPSPSSQKRKRKSTVKSDELPATPTK